MKGRLGVVDGLPGPAVGGGGVAFAEVVGLEFGCVAS